MGGCRRFHQRLHREDSDRDFRVSRLYLHGPLPVPPRSHRSTGGTRPAPYYTHRRSPQRQGSHRCSFCMTTVPALRRPRRRPGCFRPDHRPLPHPLHRHHRHHRLHRHPHQRPPHIPPLRPRWLGRLGECNESLGGGPPRNHIWHSRPPADMAWSICDHP